MTRHQYGISALVSQTPFRWGTVCFLKLVNMPLLGFFTTSRIIFVQIWPLYVCDWETKDPSYNGFTAKSPKV